LPEPRILLCGPSPQTMAPPQALDMLKQSALPNSLLCVITNGKFDTGNAAKTFNIDAGYSPEPPRLLTFAAWAGLAARSAEQCTDGHELFALRSVIKRDGPFDYALLQRGPTKIDERWPDLKAKIEGKLFLAVQHRSVLFNLGDERSSDFLQRAWELYSSGAVYGMADYSLKAALSVAAEAVRLEREIATD
jgi:hypothetical protein